MPYTVHAASSSAPKGFATQSPREAGPGRVFEKRRASHIMRRRGRKLTEQLTREHLLHEQEHYYELEKEYEYAFFDDNLPGIFMMEDNDPREEDYDCGYDERYDPHWDDTYYMGTARPEPAKLPWWEAPV